MKQSFMIQQILNQQLPKRTSVYFIVLLLLVTVFAFFQNCGDVNISSNPTQQPPPPTAALGNRIFCSRKGPVYDFPLRVTFVLDMSFSNIGKLQSRNEDYHSIYYRLPDGATDVTGQRFDQIRNFISQCGENENVKFSTIGFARDSMFATAHSCLSGYEDLTEALSSVEGLKRMQEHDLQVISGMDNNPYYLQDMTDYSKGLSCLKDKIENDLALVSESSSPVHFTFFVTDGQPNPSLSTSVYTNSLLQIRDIASDSGSNFEFFPYFYTGSSTTADEKANAMSILTEMAQSINPSNQAQVLDNFTGASQSWCNKIHPKPAEIYYHLKTLYALNLTAIMDKNTMQSDSDMDGVSDQVEETLGWNPVHARSTGILDGLCWLGSKDKAQCQELARGCTNEPLGLGLNTCDQSAALHIFGRPLNGIDSDSDGVLDYFEIIRNLNPAQDDQYRDASGDGVLNFEKFHQGLDVTSSLKTYPVEDSAKIKLEYGQEVDSDSCPSPMKTYSYNLSQFPTVSVLEYTDPKPGIISFSHGRDENIVLIVSVWESSSGLTLKKRVYFEKLMVPWGAKSPTSSSSELLFLGEYQ